MFENECGYDLIIYNSFKNAPSESLKKVEVIIYLWTKWKYNFLFI